MPQGKTELHAQQAALDAQIAALQEEKRRNRTQLNALDRQARQKRLVEVGLIVEAAVGLDIADDVLEKKLLAEDVGRGPTSLGLPKEDV